MINWLKKQIRSLYTTGYHPRDPALVRWFYGSNIADAGVHVDEYSALTYSAVWAATRRITESIAGLPIRTYTKIESRREEVTDHPSAVLLATRPNPEMTWFTFLETLQAHVLLWGNAYAEIVFDAGQPVELWPITPNRVVPRRDGKDLKYDIYPGHWLEHPRPSHRLSPFQMIHVKGLGFDGIRGYSVVEMAKQSIGLGLAEEQFGAKYFGNGARPDGVLQTPNTMDAEAQKRLREQWEELYGGPSRAGRVAVLEEGLEYNKITIPPNDSQFLESRQFQIADIARWFNIQPHMIGDLSRSTFSNIEVQGQEFVTYTLRPWFVRWEQELNTKLWPFEPGIYETEFDADELIRGTITTRYQSYNTGRNGGWLSFNDIRRSENLPTIDEEWANQYWWPLNIGIAGEPPPEPPTPPPEGQRSGDFKEEEHPRAPDGKFGSGGDVHEVTKDDLVDDKWDKAKKVGKTILSVVNAMPTASKYLVKEAGYSEKVQNVALAVATIGDWSVPGIPAGSALVSAFALASSPTIPYKLAKKAVQGVMSKIKKRSTRSEDEFTLELAGFLESNDFDTALMVFSAALDETDDPSHALDVAKEAIKEIRSDFKEEEHPRAPDGKFGSGGGSAKNANKDTAKKLVDKVKGGKKLNAKDASTLSEHVHSLTVPEIKEALRGMGEKVSGAKKILASRLVERVKSGKKENPKQTAKDLLSKASTGLSTKEQADLAKNIHSLTVPEIKEALRGMGEKVSGTKKVLASRTLDAIREYVKAGGRAIPDKPKKVAKPDVPSHPGFPEGVDYAPKTTTLTEPQQKQLETDIQDAYRRAKLLRRNESGMVPIPDLYDNLVKMGMSPNVDDLRYVINKMDQENKVDLYSINELSEVSSEDYAKGAIGVDRGNQEFKVLYHLYWRD